MSPFLGVDIPMNHKKVLSDIEAMVTPIIINN